MYVYLCVMNQRQLLYMCYLSYLSIYTYFFMRPASSQQVHQHNDSTLQTSVYSHSFTLPAPSKLFGQYANFKQLEQILPGLNDSFLILNKYNSQLVHMHEDTSILGVLEVNYVNFTIGKIFQDQVAIIEKQCRTNKLKIRLWNLQHNIVRQYMIQKQYNNCLLFQKSGCIAVYSILRIQDGGRNQDRQRLKIKYMRIAKIQVEQPARSEIDKYQHVVEYKKISTEDDILQQVYSIDLDVPEPMNENPRIIQVDQISKIILVSDHSHDKKDFQIIYIAPDLGKPGSIAKTETIKIPNSTIFPEYQSNDIKLRLLQAYKPNDQLLYLKLGVHFIKRSFSSYNSYPQSFEQLTESRSIFYDMDQSNFSPISIPEKYHNIQFVNDFKTISQHQLSIKVKNDGGKYVQFPFHLLPYVLMIPIYYIQLDRHQYKIVGRMYWPKSNVIVGVSHQQIIFMGSSTTSERCDQCQERIQVRREQLKYGIYDKKQQVTAFLLSQAIDQCDHDLIEGVVNMLTGNSNQQMKQQQVKQQVMEQVKEQEQVL